MSDFYEELAGNLDKGIKEGLGEDYTTEDLLRFMRDEYLIGPKGFEDYTLRQEFKFIWDAQKGLDKKDAMSRRQINDDMAARHNSSYTRIYLLTRDL
jgi:hypothetical protein